MGRNQVIGIKNALLWKLPADMEHFRQLTMGKPVIMGQKTFESIGKPLPGRTNIILTLDKDFTPSGCEVAHSIEEVLEIAKDFKEVMICGGASVYKQFLPLAQRLYLTFIHQDFEGDTYFPEFNINEWKEVKRIDCEPDEKNPYSYLFVVLEKK